MNKKNKELLIPFEEDIKQLKKLIFNFQNKSTTANLEEILKLVYPGTNTEKLISNYDIVLCNFLLGKITEKITFTLKEDSSNFCAGYVFEDNVYYIEILDQTKLHLSGVEDFKIVPLSKIFIKNKFKT
jgi:hypothetical protein